VERLTWSAGEKSCERNQYIIRGMPSRLRAAALALLACAVACAVQGCSSGIFGKQYEYEEDVTLSLDGSATIIVNASLAALVALRGLDLNIDPAIRFEPERDKIRAAYESPSTRVTTRRPWRRAGRRFVQVRIEVDDIRKLSEVGPFAWSRYELVEKDGNHLFTQTVGASTFRPGTLANVGWKGSEIVAFRLHLPSRILEHNSRSLEDVPEAIQRGNILRWEQHLSDRLDGKPIRIEVRMDSQSILYRTLWLFGGAFAAAIALIALLLWWTVRRGAKEAEHV
jgi:hypothetical protein